MKPLKLDPDQPVASSDLRVAKLTTELIWALRRRMRPTREEVATWLQTIRQRKNWSKSFLAAVLCIDDMELRDYEIGRIECPDPIKFLIWLYMMMDSAPAVAFDIQHQVTWGKVAPTVANTYVKLTPERRAEIVNELKAIVAANYKKYPYKITIFDMTQRYNISRDMAKVLAREAGYKPKGGKPALYKRKRPLHSLKPDSIWMNIDWRMRDKEIAEKHQLNCHTVVYARNRFRKIPKLTLCRHIGNCGKDRKHFWPFIGPDAKPYRGRKKYQKRKIIEKALTPVPENNRTTVNNKHEQQSNTESQGLPEQVQRRHDAAERELPAQAENPRPWSDPHHQRGGERTADGEGATAKG